MKVIIVEDDFIVADHFKLMLQKYGIKVAAIIDNAEEAIESISENADLYFVDIRLNGAKSGIDLGKELKANDIPFIYVSANNEISTLKKAALTLPESYITKPYKESDILAVIEILKNKNPNPYYVKSSFGKKAINLNDILYVEADGAYIKIVTENETYHERNSLSSLEEAFSGNLIRVHRSYLVNKAKIDQFNSKYIYIGKNSIPISRSYKDLINNFL